MSTDVSLSAEEIKQSDSVIITPEPIDIADLLVLYMSEWNTSGFCDSLLNERLTHINESEDHLARTPMPRLHMRGCNVSIFNRLIERIHALHQETRVEVERRRASRGVINLNWEPDSIRSAQQSYFSDASAIKPQRLHPTDRRISERRLGGGNRKRTNGRRKSNGGRYNVKSPEDFLKLDFDVMCSHPGPTLIDVLIDKEEIPPMNARMRVLGDGQ